MSPHARSGDVELNPIELDPRGTKAQGAVGGLCFADLLDHNDVWRFDLNGGGDGCDVGLASVALISGRNGPRTPDSRHVFSLIGQGFRRPVGGSRRVPS